VRFPGTEEAAISGRADRRELGTGRYSGEMIGFEATFLQPDMARALGCEAAPSLVEVPEGGMTCGNQFRSASQQDPTLS